MKAFTGIPFFRILLPFVAGILLGIKAVLPALPLFYFLLPFLPLVLLNFHGAPGRNYKWLFMVCADLFLVLLGIKLVQDKNLSAQSAYYGNIVNTDSVTTFIAAINDLPVDKEKFVKCELKVLEVRTGKTFKAAKGTIYGYFKHSKTTQELRAGQTLLIKTNLLEVLPPKNPFEFDYQNYLYNKQVYHTAFIDSSSYAMLPVTSQLNAVWQTGLTCKEFILTRLKNSGLTKNAYGICAALLTGYDDEIDKPVMEAFSHSGTLHVLSVSGLHTGLIYLAFNFLFNLFDPGKRHKLLRFVLITLVLWFFALITGYSAPVLRAVIMFNLLGFGKIYFRAGYRHQMNLLLVSAFILLACNPFYITDVGFLLSYFALFGLLYFQPKLSAYWKPNHKLPDLAWQSITASVAATISTLPITLFYFKQFPLWFFVCNLVVVPATFVLLALAVFLVFKINVLSVFVNAIVSFLIGFIHVFDAEDFGFITNIHFTFSDVFFLSAFLVLFSVAFQYRSYKYLSFTLAVLIAWQLVSILDSYAAKNKSLLAVYNVKNKTAFAVKNKTKTDLSEINPGAYNFNVRPHINSFNYAAVQQNSFNAIYKDKQLVLFLTKPGFWPDVDLKEVTTLVVSNNFKLSAQDLEKLQNLKILVMDASNNNYLAASTEQLSRNFGINFYNTKQQGAYLNALQ